MEYEYYKLLDKEHENMVIRHLIGKRFFDEIYTVTGWQETYLMGLRYKVDSQMDEKNSLFWDWIDIPEAEALELIKDPKNQSHDTWCMNLGI